MSDDDDNHHRHSNPPSKYQRKMGEVDIYVDGLSFVEISYSASTIEMYQLVR